jgi:hypothetical protein
MFVRKYDPEGKKLWTRQFGTAEYDHARGLAVNGTTVYVPGQKNAGNVDTFVTRLEAPDRALGQ